MAKICLRESMTVRVLLTIIVLLIPFFLWSSVDSIDLQEMRRMRNKLLFIKEELPIHFYFYNLIFLLTFTAGILIAIYSLAILWLKESILEIDKYQIKLHRKRYTYKINLLKVKKLVMLKDGGTPWLFVLRNDNIIRPIDLSLWKEEWLALKGVLTKISQKNNIPFDFTEDSAVVDELFEKANPVSDSETYQIKSNKRTTLFFYLFLIILLVCHIGMNIVSLIVNGYDARDVGCIIFLSPILMLVICVLAYSHPMSKVSFSLSSTCFIVGDESYEWDNFQYLKLSYGNKGHEFVSVYTQREELPLREFDTRELAEQFSYFAKRFVKLRGRGI